MKPPAGLLLTLAIGALGMPSTRVGADEGGQSQHLAILRSNGVVLTADEEAQDARELAAMINEAANLHREVTIELSNGMSILVAGRVTVQRSWLIVPLIDRSEIRFRPSMITVIKFK